MKWVVDDQCKNHFGNQFNVQVKREHPGNTIVVTAAVPPEDSILRTRCIIREYKATLENWETVMQRIRQHSRIGRPSSTVFQFSSTENWKTDTTKDLLDWFLNLDQHHYRLFHDHHKDIGVKYRHSN